MDDARDSNHSPSDPHSAQRKACCTCRREKPEGDFYWRDRTRSLRQAYCKSCKSGYNRRWYRKNRAKQIRDVLPNKQASRAELRELLAKLKNRPCMDCGGTFPIVAMDFDHVRGDKVSTVSEMVNHGVSRALLLREIDKCELVCSNCHRVRTYMGARQRGRWRVRRECRGPMST